MNQELSERICRECDKIKDCNILQYEKADNFWEYKTDTRIETPHVTCAYYPDKKSTAPAMPRPKNR